MLFVPLVAVIQNLSGGGGGPTEMPAMARVMLHPVFGILLLVLAIAALGVSIRGAKSAQTGRGRWILLAVINTVALLSACMVALAAPKFAGLFRDMGIK